MGGRRSESEAGQVYRDQQERDGALESRYRLWCNGDVKPWDDKPCCQSLLQHVATHQHELLAEYMQWVHDNHAPHAYDAEMLARWEVERFGDRAYTSAHCLLLYRVKVAVFGETHRNKPLAEPKLTPGLTDAQRRDRMLVAVDRLAEGKSIR